MKDSNVHSIEDARQARHATISQKRYQRERFLKQHREKRTARPDEFVVIGMIVEALANGS